LLFAELVLGRKMQSCFTPAPIPSVDQLTRALLGVRDQQLLADSYLLMLRA
jgi:hypothetical protein